MSISDNQITLTAAAAANVVITAKPAILERVIIGADVNAAVVEISNSPDDGDGEVIFYQAGNTLRGVYEVGAVCAKGLAMDLTNQTQVTVVWRNVGM
jgi:hypothetical protein